MTKREQVFGMLGLIPLAYVYWRVSDFFDRGLWNEFYDRYLTGRWTFSLDDICAIGIAVAILWGMKMFWRYVFRSKTRRGRASMTFCPIQLPA